jgi:hypothetical protein
MLLQHLGRLLEDGRLAVVAGPVEDGRQACHLHVTIYVHVFVWSRQIH